MLEDHSPLVSDEDFELVRSFVDQCTLLRTSAETLAWDERTGLPSKASPYRARQIAFLETSAHELVTSKAYVDALGRLHEKKLSWGDSDAVDELATIEDLWRRCQREQCLPKKLVNDLAIAKVEGQTVWERSRSESSFSTFAPALARVFDLSREAGQRICESLGGTTYGALLDEFEPGAEPSQIADRFAALKPQLVEMLKRVQRSKDVDTSIASQVFNIDKQRQLSKAVCEAIGYDFARGRLDETTHPFCTTLGPDDVRILTRYQTDWLPAGLYGSLHEAGHGIYEQGLRSEWFGLPPGEYLSLGVHESQSRFWENQIGRSKPFAEFLWPQLNQLFPEQFANQEIEAWHRAVNAIRGSFIRVEADELTYNLHILIRFDLERAIIDGELAIDDLPAVWNERYRDDLGVEVSNDREGVLQDVHWSAGLIGYFATYTLGNMVAAQLDQAIRAELPDLDDQVRAGEFCDIKQWLSDKVHRHGRTIDVDELLVQATGVGLSAQALIEHLDQKVASLA